MNRFNKVVALFSLVALIGAQNAVADSRIDQIKQNTKKFSRDLATYAKCLRTGKPCDPEIRARLMQDFKVIGVGLVAVVGTTTGAVLGARSVMRSRDFMPRNIDISNNVGGVPSKTGKVVSTKYVPGQALLEKEQQIRVNEVREADELKRAERKSKQPYRG